MMRLKSIVIEGMHNVAEKKYEFNDTNYLYGRNGAGKSTVLKAIQLALLGYIPGTAKKNSDIFRHAKGKMMSVTATLVTDAGEVITIERSLMSTNGTTVTTSLEVTPKDYPIDTIIGELELPIFNFNEFMSMTANKMKEWFIGYLPNAGGDIDWEKELSEVVKDVNVIDESLLPEVLLHVNTFIEEGKTGVELVQAVNEKLKALLSFENGQLTRLQSTIQSLIYYDDCDEDVDIEGCNAAIVELQHLNADLAAYNAQEAATASIRAALNAIQLPADSVTMDPEYIAAVNSAKELNDKAATLRGEAETLKKDCADCRKQEAEIKANAEKYVTEMKALSEKRNELTAAHVSKVSVINEGGICPYTSTECDSIKKMIETLNVEADELAKQISEVSGQLDEANNSYLEEMRSAESKKELGDRFLSQAQAKLDEAYSVEAEANRITQINVKNITDRYTRRNELQAQLNAATKTAVPPTGKTSEQLLAEIKDLQDKVVKAEANKKYNELTESLTKEKYKIENTISVLKMWIKHTDANGMQTTIMEEPFNALAESMNKYLRVMFGNPNVTAEFYLSSKANSFSFGLVRDEKYIAFDLLSTGEQCLYTVALMMCLTAASPSPLKLILIDDILDHLDNKNALGFFTSVLQVEEELQLIIAGVKECKVPGGDSIIIPIE